MKNRTITFTANIEQASPKMDAAYIRIPFDVKAEFGKLCVKVKATFDGIEYRGSIATMDKKIGPIFGLRKDIRNQINKTFGDEILVTIEEDKEPRVVIVPQELQITLENNPEVKTLFEKLAYTHRKEYVNWINEAKKAETRERRIKKTIEMIAEGKKYS
ncbi:MAG: DUF1905 domain-containing protein [Calditrichaeota bacterium]|nr:MAG: DUF1905 domain-containing protein [Calditrichota bacterium]MBL1204953.1 DUF1905 domain-containing protein [Calditrichota bacterium]NOG44781.1 DUF1905 domain-containing protein [Calditrichota bacterium]